MKSSNFCKIDMTIFNYLKNKKTALLKERCKSIIKIYSPKQFFN